MTDVDLSSAARSFVSAEQTHETNSLQQTKAVLDRERTRLQIAALNFVAEQIRIAGEVIAGKPGQPGMIGATLVADYVESLADSLEQ